MAAMPANADVPMVQRLRTQAAEMRALASLPEAQLFARWEKSAWTPSEHLDHSLKVAVAVVRTLLRADAQRGRRISALGRLILFLGWIPRGRGKAPERLSGARASSVELLATLDHHEAQLAQLEASHLASARGPIVPHPYFGGLTPPQALRFVAIHTHHHLKIVADVLRRGVPAAG